MTAMTVAPTTTIAPTSRHLTAVPSEWDTFTAAESREWIAAGFDADEATAWDSHGFSAQEATDWSAAGWYPEGDTGAWVEEFDSPDEASAWRNAGWTAVEAGALAAAGVDIDAAAEWLGLDGNVDNIIRCVRAGVAPAENDYRAGMANSRARFALDEDDWS